MTPREYYARCVKDTHDLAIKHGFVSGGVKAVPELMPLCRRLIDSDLNCSEITSEYSDTAELVEALSYRCLMYGIILANTWHNDFSNLGYITWKVERDGPNGYIQYLAEDVLGFTPSRFSSWMEAVYLTCMYALDEVDDMEEAHNYCIMEACFQMGVSMMLSHYEL